MYRRHNPAVTLLEAAEGSPTLASLAARARDAGERLAAVQDLIPPEMRRRASRPDWPRPTSGACWSTAAPRRPSCVSGADAAGAAQVARLGGGDHPDQGDVAALNAARAFRAAPPPGPASAPPSPENGQPDARRRASASTSHARDRQEDQAAGQRVDQQYPSHGHAGALVHVGQRGDEAVAGGGDARPSDCLASSRPAPSRAGRRN